MPQVPRESGYIKPQTDTNTIDWRIFFGYVTTIFIIWKMCFELREINQNNQITTSRAMMIIMFQAQNTGKKNCLVFECFQIIEGLSFWGYWIQLNSIDKYLTGVSESMYVSHMNQYEGKSHCEMICNCLCFLILELCF